MWMLLVHWLRSSLNLVIRGFLGQWLLFSPKRVWKTFYSTVPQSEKELLPLFLNLWITSHVLRSCHHPLISPYGSWVWPSFTSFWRSQMKILKFEISGIAHSHYDEEKFNCSLLSIHSYLCRSYKAWAIESVIPHFPNSIGIYSFCLPQASLL